MCDQCPTPAQRERAQARIDNRIARIEHLEQINAALLEALKKLVSRQRECGVECEVTMDLTVKARAAIRQAKGDKS